MHTLHASLLICCMIRRADMFYSLWSKSTGCLSVSRKRTRFRLPLILIESIQIDVQSSARLKPCPETWLLMFNLDSSAIIKWFQTWLTLIGPAKEFFSGLRLTVNHRALGHILCFKNKTSAQPPLRFAALDSSLPCLTNTLPFLPGSRQHFCTQEKAILVRCQMEAKAV